MAADKQALAKKIEAMYPEIPEHGIDVQLEFLADEDSWLVTFSKGEHSLATHMDDADAQKCLQDIECVHLGVQLGRFVDNYCRGADACRT